MDETELNGLKNDVALVRHDVNELMAEVTGVKVLVSGLTEDTQALIREVHDSFVEVKRAGQAMLEAMEPLMYQPKRRRWL